MGAIIGAHIVGGVQPWKELLAIWQPRLVCIVDPEAKDMDALPSGVTVVGRIYVPDAELDARIRANPEEAAKFAHDKIRASSAFGNKIYWIVENEILQLWDGLPFLNRYMVRRMELANDGVYKCAIGATSNGNLDMPEHDRLALYRQVFPALQMAEARGHLWVVHGYGWPTLWEPKERGAPDWMVHRLEHELIPRLKPQFPKLKYAMTEIGLDRLIFNEIGGWQEADITAEKYATDLYNLGQYLEQFSGDVLGYAVFTLGHNAPWSTYDIQGEVANRLAELYRQEREAKPKPEPDGEHTVHLPIVTKPGKPEQEVTMLVIDKDGTTRDWPYLTGKYGGLKHLVPDTADKRFVLKEVWETEGPAVAMATVLGTDGKPLPGYQVAFSWPDAPVDLGPHNYVSKWRPRAVIQSVGQNGDTGFGLGDGSYIRDLSAGGPHAMWVLSDQYASEGLGNFGMLGGSNHAGPLRLIFQLIEPKEEPQPVPEPAPEPEPTPAPVPDDDKWERSIAWVLKEEGGFQDNPNDPGNYYNGVLIGTKYGISAASWGGQYSIPDLTIEQAREIYHKHYWQASGADLLDWPLCLLVLDSSVLHGVGAATFWLNEVGPDPYRFAAKRLRVYTRSKNWEHFGQSWVDRTGRLLEAMAT